MKNLIKKTFTRSRMLGFFTMVYGISTLGLITFGTFCAFQNKEKESFDYQTDIKPLSEYFDGGIGTLTQPYIISSETAFINLQKLNQLGCFTYNTYFNLGADITFGDTTILEPIGTENCPFNSQFDGMGYTLSNVKVSSVNHEDVGLFGYVGSGGMLKNFILDTPTITSTGPSTKIENPLENIVPSSAISTPTYTSTSVTMTSKTIDGTDNKTYTVYFRSANKSIISDDGTLITSNITNNNKFSVLIDAIITTTVLVNEKPIVVTYVVDRFKVIIEKKAILTTDGVLSLFDRTNDGDGTYTTLDPHYYEDQNGARILDNVNYTGFVAGHIDGEATYIGVYNGTLTINSRETISFSSLFGRTKDDNLLNSMDNQYYYQDVNFDTIMDKRPDLAGKKLADEGTPKSTQFSNTANGVTYNYPNQYPFSDNVTSNGTKGSEVDTGYTSVFNSTQSGLEEDGILIPTAFRLYGEVATNVHKDASNSEVFYAEEDGVIYNQPGEELKLNSFYYTKDLYEHIQGKIIRIKPTLGSAAFYRRGAYFSINNCIWLYPAKTALQTGNTSLNDILETFFGKNAGESYITLKVTYSVNNCQTAVNNDTEFVVKNTLFNANYNIPNDNFTPFINAGADGTIKAILSNSGIDESTDPNYSVSPSTDPNSAPTGYWHFIEATKDIADVESSDSDGNVISTKFNPDVCTNSNYSKVLQTKIISLIKNTQTSGSGIGALINGTAEYDPLLLIGFKNLSGTDNKINIVRTEILISYDQGNFTYSLNKVDFLYDLNASYDSSQGTWTNWAKKESGVKIYICLQDLESGDTNTNLNTGVVVTYTRSSTYSYRVTATYTVLGDASYAPSNTSGAAAATITDGR